MDLAAGTARIGAAVVPVKVTEDRGAIIELEAGGERFKVEGWPSTPPEGPTDLVVNREKVRFQLLEAEAVRNAAPAPTLSSPTPTPSPASGGEGGTPVVPPMPGKVLEVRVKEGDRVTAGQPLLVLEAMKMRNEILSPAAGTVRSLTATAGRSVKAKEVLLRIVAP